MERRAGELPGGATGGEGSPEAAQGGNERGRTDGRTDGGRSGGTAASALKEGLLSPPRGAKGRSRGWIRASVERGSADREGRGGGWRWVWGGSRGHLWRAEEEKARGEAGRGGAGGSAGGGHGGRGG